MIYIIYTQLEKLPCEGDFPSNHTTVYIYIQYMYM